MAAAATEALRDPAVGGRLAGRGTVHGGGTPEEFARVFAREKEVLARVIRLAKPHVMLGVNVFAAPTGAEARLLFSSLQQAFVNLRSGWPGELPAPAAGYEERLDPRARAMLDQALACSIVGGPETVRRGLRDFAERTGADELMVTAQIHDHAARLRSFAILAASSMFCPGGFVRKLHPGRGKHTEDGGPECGLRTLVRGSSPGRRSRRMTSAASPGMVRRRPPSPIPDLEPPA